MISVLTMLLALAGQWMFGLVIARFLVSTGRHTQSSRPVIASFTEQMGLGIVLGIGLTSWFLFVWSLCGGTLSRVSSLIPSAIGFVCGVPVFVTEFHSRRHCSANGIMASVAQQQDFALRRICQWWVAVWVFVAIAQSMLTPQRFWDERATFGIKGAVLFEDETIRSRDLAERDFVQGHPRYPLLLPLAEQNIYALLGEPDDRLSKLVFPLLYFGLVMTAVGVLSRRLSSGQAWLWGAIFATIPALMPHDYGFLCGQGDAPVACFHGVAALYLWDALEQIRENGRSATQWIGSVLVAGICGGLAAFTKDEGIAFLMVDAIALTLLLFAGLVATVRTKRASPNTVEGSTEQSASVASLLAVSVLTLGCSAVILVPWFVHRRSLPQYEEMNYLSRMSLPLLTERVGTLAWSVPHIARRLFWEWHEWGLQWWFVLTALACYPRRATRLSQLLLLLDLVGSILALLVAGMLAPIQLEEHIGGSSHRFLMQLAPVAVLFVANQLTPCPQMDSSIEPQPKDCQA